MLKEIFEILQSGLKWVKVTRVSASGEIKFFTSTDGTTYTQLGATISGTTGAIPSAVYILQIGGYAGSATPLYAFEGKIYRATISNSIGGAPVVDFNPATYNASTSQTAWTSSTGEVWTINTGTATTGYKSALVSRTLVQGDGVDDQLASTVTVTGQIGLNVSFKTLVRKGLDGILTLSSNNFGFYSDISANNGAVRPSGGGLDGSLAIQNIYNNNLQNIYYFKANQLNATDDLIFVNNSNSKGISSRIINPQTDNILFFRWASFRSNSIINTIIIDTANADATTRTATYNLIRSLNENAF